LSSLAIAKMLACSDLREEIQANWTPAWQGCTIAGHHGDGRPFTGVLLDQAGGGGGRSWKDGPDTGGLPGTPAMGIANVETYEKEFPLLYVYRRQAPDSGGPGLHRGGVGSEMMIVPHKNQGAIDVTVLTHGASQPEGHGLSGGYPSCVQVRLMLRGAKVKEALAAGGVPTDADTPRRDRLEPLAAKQRTLMQPDDAVVFMTCGGGGYGDPIKRDPAAVARDVAVGLVTHAIARDLYGVALTDDGADAAATAALRAGIRKDRLAEGRPCRDGGGAAASAAGDTILRIGDATALVDTPAGPVHACQDCGHVLADGAEDPKTGALVRERRLETASPWNRYGLTEEIVIRELCCPSCAHLLATEVRRKDDPVLLDTTLAAGAARPARAAAE
ncbi:MAG: hydantoinase B/oxoprolinase family protein, partial [Rhodospirillaceae bacterium]